ncbi:hypothetical protein HDU96_010745, partial [Phlyctochytrium bullatum]
MTNLPTEADLNSAMSFVEANPEYNGIDGIDCLLSRPPSEWRAVLLPSTDEGTQPSCVDRALLEALEEGCRPKVEEVLKCVVCWDIIKRSCDLATLHPCGHILHHHCLATYGYTAGKASMQFVTLSHLPALSLSCPLCTQRLSPPFLEARPTFVTRMLRHLEDHFGGYEVPTEDAAAAWDDGRASTDDDDDDDDETHERRVLRDLMRWRRRYADGTHALPPLDAAPCPAPTPAAEIIDFFDPKPAPSLLSAFYATMHDGRTPSHTWMIERYRRHFALFAAAMRAVAAAVEASGRDDPAWHAHACAVVAGGFRRFGVGVGRDVDEAVVVFGDATRRVEEEARQRRREGRSVDRSGASPAADVAARIRDVADAVVKMAEPHLAVAALAPAGQVVRSFRCTHFALFEGLRQIVEAVLGADANEGEEVRAMARLQIAWPSTPPVTPASKTRGVAARPVTPPGDQEPTTPLFPVATPVRAPPSPAPSIDGFTPTRPPPQCPVASHPAFRAYERHHAFIAYEMYECVAVWGKLTDGTFAGESCARLPWWTVEEVVRVEQEGLGVRAGLSLDEERRG